jgi:hypothetical protein
VFYIVCLKCRSAEDAQNVLRAKVNSLSSRAKINLEHLVVGWSVGWKGEAGNWLREDSKQQEGIPSKQKGSNFYCSN